MQRTLHTARRARARLTVRDVVNRAGRWMVVGAGVGGAFVIAEKVFGLPGAWWVWVAAPVAVAGVAAVAVELARPRRLLESASIVDEQLGLKDRLGTALAFNSPGAAADPFVQLAIEESEAVAPTADATKAVPIRFGTSWWTWPTIAAAAVAGALWLPESSILRAREQRREADVAAVTEQTRAADEIREAVRAAEQPLPEAGADAAPDAVAARRLEALEKLEEELRTGKIDADAAREEGARTLEQAAAELEERSEESQRTADATRDRLKALAAPAAEEEGALTRAMRQGDMRAAREAARELMQQADELTPEERARVVEDLRRLADELGPAQAPHSEAPGEEATNDGQAPETQGGTPGDEKGGPASDAEGGSSTPGSMDAGLREDLKEQGLSEQQTESVGESKTEDEATKSLEELGLPPEAARKLAKRVVEDAQRREAAEEAKERTEELSRSLREAAEQLEKPAAPEQPEQEPTASERGAEAGEKREPAGSQGEANRPSATNQQQGAGEKKAEGEKSREGTGESGEKSQAGGASREGQGGATPGEPGSGNGGEKRREPRPSGETAPGGTPGQSGTPAPATPGEEGSPRDKKPGAERGESGARKGTPPGEQPGASGEKSPDGSKSGGEPGAEKEGAGKTGRPGEQSGPDGQPRPAREPGAAPGETPGPDGGKKEDAGDPSRDDRAHRERAPGEGEAGGEGEEKTPSLDDLPSPGSAQGRALKKVIDNLRKMEQEQQGAARDRQSSQEMRERARKMLENATPEQKRKLEQWAKEFAKERPASTPGGEPGRGEREEGNEGGEPGEAAPSEPRGANGTEGEGAGQGDGERRGGAGLGDRPGDQPGANRRDETASPPPGGFRTDVVDARPDQDGPTPTGGRVGGEVAGEGKPGAPMLSKQEAIEAVRRAQESAERAIDDRTIPGRFDRLLRRYFKRLPEKLEETKK